MNYKITNNTNRFFNISFALAQFLVLCFFFCVFTKHNPAYALIDCAVKDSDLKTCGYFGLNRCKWLLETYPTMKQENIRRRENCADIIDLPLCEQIIGEAIPSRNCVNECSIGVDQQHNVNCIRFCDRMTTDPYTANKLEQSGNCISRKCHQITNTATSQVITSIKSTCSLDQSGITKIDCRLLTPSELQYESASVIQQPFYCNATGERNKCFNFTEAQLPYVKTPNSGPVSLFGFSLSKLFGGTCQIHDCRNPCTEESIDDVSKIIKKGMSYVAAYEKFVTSGYKITSNTMCNQVICKPKVKVYYECLGKDNTIPSSKCEVNTCKDYGYCYAYVDCNDPSNSLVKECMNVGYYDYQNQNKAPSDMFSSWFYRPTPPEKALKDNGYSIKIMKKDKICYTTDIMYDEYDWGTKDAFGEFHHDYLTYDTRSPGLCDVTDLGSRNQGYGGLCGVGLDSAAKLPSDSVGFYKSNYSAINSTSKKITNYIEVCLRFNNSMIHDKTCGSRECGITCGGAFGCTQVCGFDKCVKLSVDDLNPYECMMSNHLMTNKSDSRGCAELLGDDGTFDGYLRLRAVKYAGSIYGESICAFLDYKGDLAYNERFFNGSEKFEVGNYYTKKIDKVCVSGRLDKDKVKCEDSIDTNGYKGRSDIWRTVKMIKYVGNVIPNDSDDLNVKGYVDRDGRIYYQQDCPKIPFKIGTPRLYNLATIENSENLFTPPLYILNARKKRGGDISFPKDPSSSIFGVTDFHYPEIDVRFGTTSTKLSLGIGYTGNEEEGKGDVQGVSTMTTVINDFTYTAKVLVKKEFNDNGYKPMFCLYKKDEVMKEMIRVGCVERELPEIDNSKEKLNIPSLDLRKIVVSLVSEPPSTYDKSKISMRYLSSEDLASNKCSSDSKASCTTTVEMENEIQEKPNCDSSLEGYQICVQREECSKLKIECVKNEVEIHNAKINNQPYDSLIVIKENCEKVLLPMCMTKIDPKYKNFNKSISDVFLNKTQDITNQKEGDRYGWFNEICIVSGFESKKKKIIAYKNIDGIKGKCIIDPLSPYIKDGNPNTNCDEGGKYPNCLCLEAIVEPSEGMEERYATDRESGLCVDMPETDVCKPIDYNPYPRFENDPEYIDWSIKNNADLVSANKTPFYNDLTGIHTSHDARTKGTISGHAEFPVAFSGMNDVSGECKGFWKYDENSIGSDNTPKLNCGKYNGKEVDWQKFCDRYDCSKTQGCIRYTCNQIDTSGPYESGEYSNGYAILETGEDKGLFHGFALWNSFTKTNDFLELTTAKQCITGFRAGGSVYKALQPSLSLSDYNNLISRMANGKNVIDSVYSKITGYEGGTLPTRYCNQIGAWLPSTTSYCQRITCPAITPPVPDPNNRNDPAWKLWANSGGATFPTINASRSSSRIQKESVAYGTCQTQYGFYQQSGTPPPSRNCDHLGNWGPIMNPCVTKCDPISLESQAANESNGYAYWGGVQDVEIGGFRTVDVDKTRGNGGCIAGFVPYPYPPLKDNKGSPLFFGSAPYRDSDDSSIISIPQDVSLDKRTPSYPKRTCESVVTAGGVRNVWTAPSSSCIKTCPGADTDSRIGVGVTRYSGYKGVIDIRWPEAQFNTTVFVYKPEDKNMHNASNYYKNRTNEYYIASRRCNPNGKWDEPVIHCGTNGVRILEANATFQSANGIIPVNSTVEGACISGYYPVSGVNPKYICKNDGKIDQTYLEITGGTKPCEQPCKANLGEEFGNLTNVLHCGSSGSYMYKNPFSSDNNIRFFDGAQCNPNIPAKPGSSLFGMAAERYYEEENFSTYCKNSVNEDNEMITCGSQVTQKKSQVEYKPGPISLYCKDPSCSNNNQFQYNADCTNSRIVARNTNDCTCNNCDSNSAIECIDKSCSGPASLKKVWVSCRVGLCDEGFHDKYDFSSKIDALVMQHGEMTSISDQYRTCVSGILTTQDRYCGCKAVCPTTKATAYVRCVNGVKKVSWDTTSSL